MSTLKSAKIVSYFSMPSASLAEHNPAAYNNIMAGMPAGAGACSQCGMGILHHVVIEDEDGARRFIGSDCAMKVGLDPYQVRNKLTSEQAEKRKAEQESVQADRAAAWNKQLEERAAKAAAHFEKVGDIVTALSAYAKEVRSDFHASLAQQLTEYFLSPRQADCVCKFWFPTGRRNKKNAQAWDNIHNACTGYAFQTEEAAV